MSKSIPRLGRGLSSIISAASPAKSIDVSSPSIGPAGTGPGYDAAIQRLAMLRTDTIRANPRQPRRYFDDASLNELAASLKAKGSLQPIVVRRTDAGYELVAGERRLRAARLAGIEELPAIVRQVQDGELLELALIENIQRKDLNPIERARAYKSLQEKSGLSHDEIGERVSEDRATVSNYIRLLDLSDDVIGLVETGRLSMGHARAILSIQDKQSHLSIANRAIQAGWSVRETEAAVARLKSGAEADAKEKPVARPAVRDIERRLTEAVGARVQVREGRRRHSGRIVIEYSSLDDFERVTRMLGVIGE